MKSEFMLAFNEICEARGLPKDVVIEALKTALVSAYRRNTNVSNTQEVDARNADRDFWSLHGKGLLEFREKPGIKNYTIAVETSCKKLLEWTDKISGDLEAIWNEYRKKYGISSEKMLSPSGVIWH